MRNPDPGADAQHHAARTFADAREATTTRTRWIIPLVAAFDGVFDGYFITIHALTVPLIAVEFHVSTAVPGGTIGSIFLIGYSIGTIGFGVSGDVFGRRLMPGISIFGYGLVTALIALAQGVGALAASRSSFPPSSGHR